MVNELIKYLPGFQTGQCVNLKEGGVPDVAGLFCAIGNTINLLLVFAGAMALLYFLYGGIQYMASAGDEKSMLAAKNTLVFATLGLFLILGSIILLNLALNIVSLK